MITSEYSVSIGAKIPTRFAVIADLHARPTDILFSIVRNSSPDAVLMPGDIFDTRADFESTIAFLQKLCALCPVFCSLGNHDSHLTAAAVHTFKNTGAVVLNNASTVFRGINIGGLTSGFFTEYRNDLKKTAPPDLEWLSAYAAEAAPHLLLSHHPEYYPDYIRDTCIELTISGHAHGGQWHFFGRGVFAPGQGLFPKYTAGEYDGGRLIVSRGVTNTVRLPRFFNPIETVIVNVR